MKLPRIYNTDKPVPEDLPQFVEDLAQKLLLQVQRVQSEEIFPQKISEEIKKHSWMGIAKRINDLL